MRTSRGAVNTVDFLIAMVIISTILIITSQIWNTTILKISGYESEARAANRAYHLSQLLLSSGGNPTDWASFPAARQNTDNISSIGLCSQQNVLEDTRIAALASMDYDDSKAIIGLTGYDYNITILNSTNHVVYSIGTTEEVQKIRVRRLAILNEEIVEVRLTLY